MYTQPYSILRTLRLVIVMQIQLDAVMDKNLIPIV